MQLSAAAGAALLHFMTPPNRPLPSPSGGQLQVAAGIRRRVKDLDNEITGGLGMHLN